MCNEDKQKTLVEDNLKFVSYIANKMKHNFQGVPFNELVQAGAYGMVLASSRFDPSKGTSFATYAKPWIKKLMFKTCGSDSYAVRNSGSHAISLDLPESELLYSGMVGDWDVDTSKTPDDESIEKESFDRLISMVNELPEYERVAISSYFGIGGNIKVKLKDIGEMYGNTPQWAHQMCSRGLRKLKYNLINKDMEDICEQK